MCWGEYMGIEDLYGSKMISFLMNNKFAMVYVAFIIVVYINYHLKDSKALSKANKEIQKATKDIKDNIKIVDSSGLREEDFNELDRLMKDSTLKNTWNQLKYSDICVKMNVNDESLVYLTQNIYEVIDPYTCITEVDGYKRRTLTPSFLTGLGILGTFIGLTWGLLGLDLSSSGMGLLAGINTLISSSGTAFITSLVGIGLSLIHIGWFHRYEKVLKSSLDDLVFTIHERIGYWSIYKQLDVHQAKTERNLYDLGLTIAKSVEESAEKLKHSLTTLGIANKNSINSSTKTIEQGLKELGTTNRDIVDGLCEKIEDKLDNIIKILEANQISTEEKIKDVGNIVRTAIFTSDNNLGLKSDNVGIALDTLSNAIDEIQDEVVEDVSNTIKTGVNTLLKSELDQFIATIDQLKEYLENAHDENNELKNKLEEAFEYAGNNLKQVMEASEDSFQSTVNLLNDTVKASEDSFQNTINLLNDTVKTSENSFQNTVILLNTTVDSMKEEWENHTKEVTKDVSEFKKIVSKSFADTAEQINQITNSTKTTNEEFKVELVIAISDSLTDMKDAITNMKNVLALEHTSLKEFKDTVGTSLEESLNSLTEKIENFTDFVTEQAVLSNDLTDKLHKYNKDMNDTLENYTLQLSEERKTYIETLNNTKELIAQMIVETKEANKDRDDSLAKMIGVLHVLEAKVEGSINSVCNATIKSIHEEFAQFHQGGSDIEKNNEEKKQSVTIKEELNAFVGKVTDAMKGSTDAKSTDSFLKKITSDFIKKHSDLEEREEKLQGDLDEK